MMTHLWTHWVSASAQSNYSYFELFVFSNAWSNNSYSELFVLFVTTDQIILILNYLFVQLDIDALSFYVYDAGFVIATSIARQPFPTGKPDRGQSLLFHEFIQSWIGYELVKVLVTFGLQPITLSSTLSKWSPDLHTIFTYMLTKNQKMKGRAEEILELLFSKTLHCGYWSHVQFGTRTKFFDQSNSVLSLDVLTWLR